MLIALHFMLFFVMNSEIVLFCALFGSRSSGKSAQKSDRILKLDCKATTTSYILFPALFWSKQ